MIMQKSTRLVASFIFVTALLGTPSKAQVQEKPSGHHAESGGKPFIKMDKTRFAVGENVFFWVGVRSTRKDGEITKQFQNTCRLLITRPDGTEKITRSSWPIDGPLNSGWMGGSGIQEPAVPGQYTLVYEFAGQKSAPETFTVEEAPSLKRVHALFVFDPETEGDTTVTLTVRNGSDQTVRFPHRDGVNGSVWVHYSGIDSPRGIQTSFPPAKLLDADEPKAPDFSFQKFTWDLSKKVATVTLKPGETYRQRLSLNDAVTWARTRSALPPGRYDVKFGTSLQLLIGEQGGKFAELSPIRLNVESRSRCTISTPASATDTHDYLGQ